MFSKMLLNILSINNIKNFDVIYNDLNIKKSRYGRYNHYYKKDCIDQKLIFTITLLQLIN